MTRVIQLCGPSHRDDGPPLYFQRAYKALGVTCDRKPVTEPESSWGSYDFVHYVDWGQDCFPSLPAAEFPPRTIVTQSDMHQHRQAYTYRLEQSRRAARVCVNQMTASAQFATDGVAASWMPHAADHVIYHPPFKAPVQEIVGEMTPPDADALAPAICPVIPRNDLCFVGFLGDPQRVQTLDQMFKAFPVFDLGIGCFFEEAVQKFHHAKLTFNCSIRGELNMRTFEVLAARAFLLTDAQDGMDALGLQDGVHCAIYHTVEEAIEKGRYYLDRDRERDAIADAGWRWCLANHTYQHRARAILDIAASLS